MKIEETKLSFLCGTDIKEAAWCAYQKAIETSAKVTFRFNGLTVSIEPSPTSGGEVITEKVKGK